MKLSMWILKEALKHYSLESFITDGRPIIENVRCFTENDIDYSMNNVYLGRGSEFFGNSDCPWLVLANERDLIIIKNGEYAELLNDVIQIFEFYDNWHSRLKEAQFKDDPFQAVIDVAHEALHCPMIVGCKNLQIYAVTNQYHDEDVYIGWDEVKTIKTMPLWLINDMFSFKYDDWQSDDVDPAILPAWPTMSVKYQLRTNCYLNGTIWGHLIVYSQDAEVYKIQIAKNVADVFGVLLNRRFKTMPEKYTTYSWLSEYLDGKEFDEDVFHTLYWRLGWDLNEKLIVYRIMTKNDCAEQNIFYWLYDNIKVQSPNTILFSHGKSIVVVSRTSCTYTSIIQDNIKRTLQLCDHHCGISFSFRGLENIRTSYKQAGYAVKYAPDLGGKIHSFDDCPFEGIINEFAALENWKGWITPDFEQLQEVDKEEGTDLYDTFVVYIENNANIAETAKCLFVHRNTIMNRIEKIRQLLNMDLKDPNIIAYLRFCLALMNHNNYVPSVQKYSGSQENTAEKLPQVTSNMYR